MSRAKRYGGCGCGSSYDTVSVYDYGYSTSNGCGCSGSDGCACSSRRSRQSVGCCLANEARRFLFGNSGCGCNTGCVDL